MYVCICICIYGYCEGESVDETWQISLKQENKIVSIRAL